MTSAHDAAMVLSGREFRRLLRQPSRLATALLTPIVFWALAGAGLAGSFAMPGASGPDESIGYAAYLLPGMATMVVMFASVLGAISLIQDRHTGFLQAVLVSPAPRWTIVLAKVLGGGTVAVAQALLLILGAAALGVVSVSVLGFIGAALVLSMTAAGVIALGIALAWRVDSVAGFHGVMNLVLLPMWVLSGALFPASGATGWLALVMWLNPLHWSHLALAGCLGVSDAPAGLSWLGGLGAALFAIIAMGGAVWTMERSARTMGAPGER